MTSMAAALVQCMTLTATGCSRRSRCPEIADAALPIGHSCVRTGLRAKRHKDYLPERALRRALMDGSTLLHDSATERNISIGIGCRGRRVCSERQSSGVWLRTLAARAIAVSRRQSVRERSPASITCLDRLVSASASALNRIPGHDHRSVGQTGSDLAMDPVLVRRAVGAERGERARLVEQGAGLQGAIDGAGAQRGRGDPPGAGVHPDVPPAPGPAIPARRGGMKRRPHEGPV